MGEIKQLEFDFEEHYVFEPRKLKVSWTKISEIDMNLDFELFKDLMFEAMELRNVRR